MTRDDDELIARYARELEQPDPDPMPWRWLLALAALWAVATVPWVLGIVWVWEQVRP